MVLSQYIEQRTGKVLCKVNVKCNVKTAKTRCLKVLATCNRRRIALGKSHNVKIIEGGFYKVLVACIKVTAGKEFHMVEAAWNVKSIKKRIPQTASHMQCKERIDRSGKVQVK